MQSVFGASDATHDREYKAALSRVEAHIGEVLRWLARGECGEAGRVLGRVGLEYGTAGAHAKSIANEAARASAIAAVNAVGMRIETLTSQIQTTCASSRRSWGPIAAVLTGVAGIGVIAYVATRAS